SFSSLAPRTRSTTNFRCAEKIGRVAFDKSTIVTHPSISPVGPIFPPEQCWLGSQRPAPLLCEVFANGFIHSRDPASARDLPSTRAATGWRNDNGFRF